MFFEPPKFPFLDFIKQKTEALTKFVQWVAELISRRNWVSLLMLVDAVLILFCTPEGMVPQVLKSWFTFNLPQWYQYVFWLTVASIFIAVIIIAVRNRPREIETPQGVERTAIKGLRAFTSKDTEIFKRLERESDLNRCVESIAHGDFRFGILMGLSGCGKTSFLQAGLLPRLKEPGYNLRGVYVRFSDEEPLKTIQKAIAKALEIPLDWLEGGFLQLVTKAVEAARSPVVLFLDQFEQWFVHYKGEEERKPLLQGLKEWYDQEPGNVKIVVSIRSDLYYRLNEVQQCLGYNLGPQDVFELKKFSPQQATQVLKAIAETEQLGFDEGFLAKLTKEELADKEDGLISPVDLQILAWMITAQNTFELRAFNKNAFQKFGGVEELLSRYLQEVLLAQTMKTRREAAVNVLLALIDLEQQVRSGVLTLEELAAQNPHVQSQEIKAAVKWLEKGDVRLITPVEKDNSMGYELAHERLIGAVMKQANQELTNVSRANKLLERRVNEWLGNNHSRRYLLPWWELRFIEKNKSHWGSKREEKQRLLTLSRGRIYRFASVFIAFALMVVSFTGWLQFTPQGQIYRVYWSITNPWDKHLEKIDDEKAAEVAVAIAKYGKWEYAFQLVREQIKENGAKEDFLWKFSKVVPRQQNTNQSEAQLKQALALAQEIKNPESRSEALSSIAVAYGELGNSNAALETLKASLNAAEQIENSASRSVALSAIAAAYGELGNSNAAQEGLKALFSVAQQIENSFFRSEALSAIAAAYGQLGDSKAALKTLKDSLNAAEQIENSASRTRALRAIAAAYGQLGDSKDTQEGLKALFSVAQQFDDSYHRSEALIAIAGAYGELGDSKDTQEGLKALFSVAQQFENSVSRSEALRAIAGAYGELGDSKDTQEGLKALFSVAQQIDDSYSRSRALRAIAAAYGQLGDSKDTQEGLKALFSVAQQIENSFFRSEALSAIAAAYGELGDSNAAQETLKDSLKAAKDIENLYSRSEALSAIAAAYGKLGDSNAAQEGLKASLKAAKDIENSYSRREALSAIAAAYGELGDSNAAQEGLKASLKAAEEIENSYSRSETLSAIATAAGQLPNPMRQSILQDTLTVAETANAGEALAEISSQYALHDAWGKALHALRRCPNAEKVSALAKILTLWSEQRAVSS